MIGTWLTDLAAQGDLAETTVALFGDSIRTAVAEAMAAGIQAGQDVEHIVSSAVVAAETAARDTSTTLIVDTDKAERLFQQIRLSVDQSARSALDALKADMPAVIADGSSFISVTASELLPYLGIHEKYETGTESAEALGIVQEESDERGRPQSWVLPVLKNGIVGAMAAGLYVAERTHFDPSRTTVAIAGLAGFAAVVTGVALLGNVHVSDSLNRMRHPVKTAIATGKAIGQWSIAASHVARDAAEYITGQHRDGDFSRRIEQINSIRTGVKFRIVGGGAAALAGVIASAWFNAKELEPLMEQGAGLLLHARTVMQNTTVHQMLVPAFGIPSFLLTSGVAKNAVTGLNKMAFKAGETPIGNVGAGRIVGTWLVLGGAYLHDKTEYLIEAGRQAARDRVQRVLGRLSGPTDDAIVDTTELSGETVWNHVHTQLLETGRVDREAAARYADLHRAFAMTAAMRLGISPMDVHKLYGLRIEAAMQEAESNAVRYRQTAIDAMHARQGDLLGGFASGRSYLRVEEQINTQGDVLVSRRGNVNSAGHRVTNTRQGLENFWQWFDGSAVVDDKGRPLVVYHGTRGDFSEFEIGRETTNMTNLGTTWETRRAGIFFSSDRAFAQQYAGDGSGANLMPAYLDIKNPADMRNGVPWDLYEELEQQGFNSRIFTTLSAEMWEFFDEDNGGDDLVKALQGAGYDGALITETDEDGIDQPVYVVFRPEQVKSAIGNLGTFRGDTGNILYQFVGEQAETTDRRALWRAENRLAAGEDPEQIRLDTGWHVGADGRWRYEIDDSGAHVDFGVRKGTPITHGMAAKRAILERPLVLGDVLSHPALYAAYPQLAEYRLLEYPMPDAQRGQFHMGVDVGHIHLDSSLDLHSARSSLLHEIQHAIQQIEGFSAGGTPGDSPVDYWRSAGEVEARNTQVRAALNGSERRTFPPAATADVPDSDVIVVLNGIERPGMVLPANAYLPLNTARGAIELPDDFAHEPAVIQLFAEADRSTFLHESAHYFFEVYRAIASGVAPPAVIREDMETLLGYVGVDSLDTWNALSHEERRAGHEKVADAFEAYLLEGQAPSPELKGLFERFSQWLREVYRSVTRYFRQEAVTDDIRGVFDRMLAIEAAEKDQAAEAPCASADGMPDALDETEWDIDKPGAAPGAQS